MRFFFIVIKIRIGKNNQVPSVSNPAMVKRPVLINIPRGNVKMNINISTAQAILSPGFFLAIRQTILQSMEDTPRNANIPSAGTRNSNSIHRMPVTKRIKPTVRCVLEVLVFSTGVCT